jgi:hypothetical protein
MAAAAAAMRLAAALQWSDERERVYRGRGCYLGCVCVSVGRSRGKVVCVGEIAVKEKGRTLEEGSKNWRRELNWKTK